MPILYNKFLLLVLFIIKDHSKANKIPLHAEINVCLPEKHPFLINHELSANINAIIIAINGKLIVRNPFTPAIDIKYMKT